MAVKLCLGKIHLSLAQNIIAAAQLPDLPLQFFLPLAYNVSQHNILSIMRILARGAR